MSSIIGVANEYSATCTDILDSTSTCSGLLDRPYEHKHQV